MTLLRDHWQLLAVSALIALFWATPLMIPLRVLVVFFHEASHALAALMTGGEVLSLTINLQEGGLVTARGGNLFAIISAGYLGSLILGVLLFLAAMRSEADKKVLGVLGASILLITALYVRDEFAMMFCAGAGVLMLGVAVIASHHICDLILRAIGLTSMTYVPQDIFSDTIARAHLRSDAFILAETFGGTAQLWGGIWLALSVVVILLSLRFGLRGPSNLEWSSP